MTLPDAQSQSTTRPDKMQICTYSEFTFDKGGHKFQAFKNMSLGSGIFGKPAGLETVKAMGTGSGNGFSIWPNFKRYAFFALWEDEKSANAYFAEAELPQWYKRHAVAHLHAKLIPVKAHGSWGGGQPLRTSPELANDGPLAVLTRATIRPSRLIEFWLNVPKVSRFMAGAEGAIHELGVGEYPLFMQATFSIWESKKALYAAAYKNTAHAEVVKKTRERNWYSEEMFAQFKVLGLETKGAQHDALSKKSAVLGL